MRQGGGLVEAHARRHRLEGLLRRGHVLGKGAHVAGGEQVGEDLVTGAEAGHAGAHRLDHPGDIDAHLGLARFPQPDEEADELGARLDVIEVSPVDRCGPEPNEHLVLGRNRRVQVLDPNDVWRPVSVSDGRFHTGLLCHSS